MKEAKIDESTRFLRSSAGNCTEIRENCTIHDSVVGEKCRIYEKVSLKKVTVKNGVDINAGTHLEYAEVEDDVQIGPNCSIVGVFHRMSESGAERDDTYKKVVIRERSFIGAGTIILPGVEIGEGSVVGAGAIVTRNIPAFHICVGVPPNQTIKSLGEWLGKDRQQMKKPIKILFVCYGNAARSVMAKYFCDTISERKVVAESAGIHPILLGDITPDIQKRLLRATLSAMKEVGIDVSSHRSKHIQEVDVCSFDIMVNMSPFSFTELLRQYAPDFKGTVMEWSVPDPGDSSVKAVRKARDQVRKKVIFLIEGITKGGI